MRWQEVAAAFGAVYHPAMEWHAISTDLNAGGNMWGEARSKHLAS
ncbi:hypothetical protein [Gordonia sp. SID5947]|nr:hypothetical protein [Gordonia sp. SID5947]